MTSHTARKHARLAPSAAHRWWMCPGSIRLSQGIPDRGSVFADEGTSAHELAQHCLTTGFSADRFLGEHVNLDADKPAEKFNVLAIGERSFPIDEEMADGVQQYVDYVSDIALKTGVEVQYEEFVDLSYMGVPGLDGGTADFCAYDPVLKMLTLVDFKYGRGVAVDPQENKQLLCYALGAIRRWSNRGLAKLRLAVVQPRCPHPSGQSIREWDADVLDLLDFEAELKARALATQEPDAPLAAGEWCRFCPAAPTCPARRDHVLRLAQAEFSTIDEMELPVVTEMPPEELARILTVADQIEDWCRRVKDHAHMEASHGRIPPGFKLVAKRATRKWRDETEAFDALEQLVADSDAIWQPRKMKSPAQIEPLMPGANKKKRAAALNFLVVKESSGTVLAPDSDPRPAVQADASEFGEVA